MLAFTCEIIIKWLVVLMLPGLLSPANPVVFMDVQVGDQLLGRLQFELFQHLLPRTTRNFYELCTGDHLVDERPVGYKHSSFSKVVKGTYVLGGDLGPEPRSIYGGYFEDENFEVSHAAEGILTMVNDGPNTNSSRFAILFAAAPWMDGQNVAFGRLYGANSLSVLRTLAHTPTGAGGTPLVRVRVAECGEM